jgi:hypothetical protein
MAVDAVQCEPLSVPKFPLTGKNTGNFFTAANRFSPVFMRVPADFAQFCRILNREFLMG